MLMQMAATDLSLGEAARAIGVSADTLRRWERAGKLRTRRDAANRRRVSRREVERLARGPRRAPAGGALSARHRVPGGVRAGGGGGVVAVGGSAAGPPR